MKARLTTQLSSYPRPRRHEISWPIQPDVNGISTQSLSSVQLNASTTCRSYRQVRRECVLFAHLQESTLDFTCSSVRSFQPNEAGCREGSFSHFPVRTDFIGQIRFGS